LWLECSYENKRGLTATELAEQLHMSVPTLYRLTLEMHQLRLLASEKQGRKNVFKISSSAEGLLPPAYSNAKTILESKQSKTDQQLSMTKSVLEDYNLSLSPRVAESVVFSTLKQKINEYLPNGIRYGNKGSLKTV
jgi:DNA-binding transcriptional regulator GbsR (MarR family)